jgi:L-proline amide hydrolase
MSAIADQTGTVGFTHESLDQQVHTFYRIIGDLKSGQRPLIAAHGGPGSSHDYFLNPLASYPEETGRPLVLYDQIGNAKSTNFTFESKSLPNLSVDVYTAELNNLVTKLGIQEFDYLGHSWGGMMGLEYVIKYQPNIKHLILDSVPASVKLWTNKIKDTLNELDPAERDLALELDAAQQYEDPRLQAILKKLQDKHVCRLDPWPEAAQGFFGIIMGNPAVYATMLGPSQFDTLGALKGKQTKFSSHAIAIACANKFHQAGLLLAAAKISRYQHWYFTASMIGQTTLVSNLSLKRLRTVARLHSRDAATCVIWRILMRLRRRFLGS